MNLVMVRILRSLQRNILAGIITAGPLFVTGLVFSFVLGSLFTILILIVLGIMRRNSLGSKR